MWGVIARCCCHPVPLSPTKCSTSLLTPPLLLLLLLLQLLLLSPALLKGVDQCILQATLIQSRQPPHKGRDWAGTLQAWPLRLWPQLYKPMKRAIL